MKKNAIYLLLTSAMATMVFTSCASYKKPFEAGGVYCYVNPHRMRPADVWLEASDWEAAAEETEGVDADRLSPPQAATAAI